VDSFDKACEIHARYTPVARGVARGDRLAQAIHSRFDDDERRRKALTLSALNDLDEALWQLAHETVHILGPVEREKANNLEEGVATRFALNITHYRDKSRVAIFRQVVQQASPRYRSALQDCEAPLQIDSDIIKKLRKQQPYLSRITAKQILDVLPNCDPTLADRLTGRFPIDEVSTV
jgi:hypothetical protein